ncbi:hypothetical protein [Halovivax gelatinilyticus]|uniref:hypothetical protein n=1 Tax=Halovivax gelatinilyticus TaxID=2961597 RepID=UPI0020CA633B|nr:hypothetical protein [Halovivax gelatinilyticus]
MAKIKSIQQGGGFVIPLQKKTTGFKTVWGELKEELPKLPDNVRITRIDSDIKVNEGAIGKGYVKVYKMTKSSSGSVQYLWVDLKKFEHVRYVETKKGSGSNYRSHVENSHNDTATPRANQQGMPFAPSNPKR